jgi:multiple sugar transport system substrate-binding protein
MKRLIALLVALAVLAACAPAAPEVVEKEVVVEKPVVETVVVEKEVVVEKPVVETVVVEKEVTAVPTTPPKPSGKLSVGIWGSKQDVDEVRAVIENYEKEFPDVILDVQEGGCGPDYAACKTLIAGGTMFDVFVPGNWAVQAMIEDGVLVDLGPYIDGDKLDLDDFYPAALSGLRGFKYGNVYALPMGYHVEVLYYNKDMFDAAGLAYPPADGNYTWHDLREWAMKLTLDANDNDATSPDFDPDSIVQWGMYIWPGVIAGYEPVLLAFGGSTMSIPDGQKCNLENPDTIRAHQFIQDMMWKDHSAITPQVEQENAGKFRFAAGELAMLSGAHWMTTIINDQNPDLNYDVAPLPKEKAGNASVVHIHGWAIYSGSRNKDLAWHFVKWVSTVGAGPEMGLIPAYKDLALSDIFLKRPGEPEHLKEAFMDPADWPLTMGPTAFSSKLAQIAGPDGFGLAIEAIILNEKPAAEALAGICEVVDAIMSE